MASVHHELQPFANLFLSASLDSRTLDCRGHLFGACSRRNRYGIREVLRQWVREQGKVQNIFHASCSSFGLPLISVVLFDKIRSAGWLIAIIYIWWNVQCSKTFRGRWTKSYWQLRKSYSSTVIADQRRLQMGTWLQWYYVSPVDWVHTFPREAMISIYIPIVFGSRQYCNSIDDQLCWIS